MQGGCENVKWKSWKDARRIAADKLRRVSQKKLPGRRQVTGEEAHLTAKVTAETVVASTKHEALFPLSMRRVMCLRRLLLMVKMRKKSIFEKAAARHKKVLQVGTSNGLEDKVLPADNDKASNWCCVQECR